MKVELKFGLLNEKIDGYKMVKPFIYAPVDTEIDNDLLRQIHHTVCGDEFYKWIKDNDVIDEDDLDESTRYPVAFGFLDKESSFTHQEASFWVLSVRWIASQFEYGVGMEDGDREHITRPKMYVNHYTDDNSDSWRKIEMNNGLIICEDLRNKPIMSMNDFYSKLHVSTYRGINNHIIFFNRDLEL